MMRFFCLLMVLAVACSSTRLDLGTNGKASASANTSVVHVAYEGGLYAKIVDTSTGKVLEELVLDGTGEKAWRRTGLFSLKWQPMDPAEAKALLGLP